MACDRRRGADASAYLGLEEYVRAKLTPVADPRDNLGRSLVPSEDPHAAHHYHDDA